MEREKVLSSYSVKNIGNNNPENFVIPNSQSQLKIVLDNNYVYTISLNRIINMSFTWFNVNSGYDNQLVRFSRDSGTKFTDIKFPAGVWSYIDFDSYIKQKTVKIKKT